LNFAFDAPFSRVKVGVSNLVPVRSSIAATILIRFDSFGSPVFESLVLIDARETPNLLAIADLSISYFSM
jgi:hypothetical protein